MFAVWLIVAMLFACKLLWNVGVPLWLSDKRRGTGISIHLHVELALLALLAVLAEHPVMAFARGLAAIAASYCLAYAVARWLGWRYTRR